MIIKISVKLMWNSFIANIIKYSGYMLALSFYLKSYVDKLGVGKVDMHLPKFYPTYLKVGE